MEQGRTVFRVARDIWIFVGVTLIVFLMLETFFVLAFRAKESLMGSAAVYVDPRANADAYPDRSWTASYYEEFERSQVAQWQPYVYWRQRPFQGKYINITEAGRRLTPSPETARQDGARPLRIFMFGGSTLWGTGARDSMTIPAIMASELAKRGVAAEVTNFGESGYVSTQELIGFLLELQSDRIPDVVIFYDGVNDTFSAYQQGVAGMPQNEFNRVREFNLSGPTSRAKLWFIALQNSLHELSTVRFLEGILRRVGLIDQKGSSARSPSVREQDYDALAQGVITRYKSNVKMVNSLARQYGFSAFFYWQPTIFQKKHLTKYESSWRQDMQPMELFFLKTYELAQQSLAAAKADYFVRDLSQIFLDVRDPLFVDWCHLAELGNTLIAREMASDVFSASRAQVRK